MAVKWLDEGYDVMVPLLPGQGREQGQCKSNELGKLSDDGLCAGKDRIDELPLSRQGYVDFVQTINKIVKEERSSRKYSQVYVAGLSHGGPLATYAVNTAPAGVFQKLFIMNPSFAATNPPLDRQFTTCINDGTEDCISVLLADVLPALQGDSVGDDRGAGGILQILGLDDATVQGALETVFAIADGTTFDDNTEIQKYSIIQFILRRLLTIIVEHFDELPDEFKDEINRSVYSWGAQCEGPERNNGRGGICSFRTRNILAAHSFAQLALRTIAQSSSPNVNLWQIVATERDAVSRNTLVWQAGLSLYRNSFLRGGKGSVCIYRTVCNPDEPNEGGGNACGVPHSLLSKAEQELQGDRYWIDDLIPGSVDFFQSNSDFGRGSLSASDPRAVCQGLDISSTEPSFDLSLPSNRGLWLRFERSGLIDLSVEGNIAQKITDFLELLQGQVQLVDLVEVSSPFEADELYLELPATLTKTKLRDLESSLANGLVDADIPDGVSLLQVEIAGRKPVDV